VRRCRVGFAALKIAQLQAGVKKEEGRLDGEEFDMRIFRVALLLLMMAGLVGVTHAQLAVYGTFTGGKLDTAGTPWLYGGTVGVYRDHGLGLIAMGLDARGEFVRRSDASLNSGLAGIRLAVTPHVLPFKPYAEGLVGVGNVDVGQGSKTSTTAFEYKVLGGVDFTFFPRLDWRVVEFGYGGLTGDASGVHPKTLSSGLVVRLPF